MQFYYQQTNLQPGLGGFLDAMRRRTVGKKITPNGKECNIFARSGTILIKDHFSNVKIFKESNGRGVNGDIGYILPPIPRFFVVFTDIFVGS